MEDIKLSRIVVTRDIDELYDILDVLNIEYEKNYQIDDVITANVYLKNQYNKNIKLISLIKLPYRKKIIIFLNNYFVTFDKITPTGFQIMREKLLNCFSDKYQIIKLNQWQFETLKTKEDKIEYIQKIGIDKEEKLIST